MLCYPFLGIKCCLSLEEYKDQFNNLLLKGITM